MTQTVPVRTVPSRTPLLPHHRIGWWAFGVLLITGLYPIWFPFLNRASTAATIAVGIVLVGTALALGRTSILQRRDRSIVVAILFALIVVEVAFGVLFGVALALNGLFG